MNNNINSYWGVLLKPTLIKQGSDTLAIVLPGIAYTLDRVTLEYTSELALKFGFDLLKVEYGFQVARKDFNLEEEFDIAAKETLEIVNSVLEGGYKNIVIIGKSVGTCVQNVLNKNLKGHKITNVYISPINKTVNMGIEKNSIVITGSNDPLLTKENVENIEAVDGTELINFKGANHALNIDNEPLKSLDIQLKIIQYVETFLNKNLK